MLNRPTVPKAGDLLVSRPTARADVYAVRVIPTQAHIIAVRYEDALGAPHRLTGVPRFESHARSEEPGRASPASDSSPVGV
jgi:hypothetical protein